MSIFEAAVEVARFLDERGVPYAILGGLAVQHWGEPRATRDVDIVVKVTGASLAKSRAEEATRLDAELKGIFTGQGCRSGKPLSDEI